MTYWILFVIGIAASFATYRMYLQKPCPECNGRGWLRVSGPFGSSRIEDCKCIRESTL